MPALAIGAAISGLKTAGEMAGSFVKLRDEAMIQAKVIELQTVILSAQGSALAAQGEQFSLLDTKRELEAKIAELEAWDRQKERYELSEVGPGALAYTLKRDARPPEPAHMACANCFDRGRARWCSTPIRAPLATRRFSFLLSKASADHIGQSNPLAVPGWAN
jgi:hypothetical protein